MNFWHHAHLMRLFFWWMRENKNELYKIFVVTFFLKKSNSNFEFFSFLHYDKNEKCKIGKEKKPTQLFSIALKKSNQSK